eukprot:4297842-Pyramimonas_sp.AAC.1
MPGPSRTLRASCLTLRGAAAKELASRGFCLLSKKNQELEVVGPLARAPAPCTRCWACSRACSAFAGD